MGLGLFLQPYPQRPMIPIDAIPRHPGGRDARVEGTFQHLPRQLRLGRTYALLRNPRALASRLVACPLVGQIEFTIKQDVALGTCIGHKHPNLAMLNAARCAALLAGHPGRLLAFFEEPRLIDDEHGLRVAQMLDQIGAQIIPDGLRIP